MEIVIQATEAGPSGIVLGVLLGSLVVVILALFLPVVTSGDSLGVSAFLVFLGLMGALFGSFTQSQADMRAEENFALVAAEQFNIENPTPLGDDEKMGECRTGGESATSQYSWLDEDGDIVKGLIMRSPEQNGECVFTLSATS